MNDQTFQEDAEKSKNLAIMAEAFYLLNLLFLPVLAFFILIWLYLKYENYSELAGCHVRQTFSASIWAGLLLLLVTGVIVLAGGYNSPYIWSIVIVYFIICHSILVILGIIGLVKAMAGKKFHYPMIGPSC
jgi:uncharacterized Tic20 family protein